MTLKTKPQVLLALVSEDKYTRAIFSLVSSFEKGKICYVCVSKPYKDVVAELKELGISKSLFLFIDTLSSHYEKQESEKNCIFLDSPHDLDSMMGAIKRAIEMEGCQVLLFDSISALLAYRENFPILKFTYSLAEGERQKAVEVFLALKRGAILEKENSALIEDIKMFADKTLDFG